MSGETLVHVTAAVAQRWGTRDLMRALVCSISIARPPPSAFVASHVIGVVRGPYFRDGRRDGLRYGLTRYEANFD